MSQMSKYAIPSSTPLYHDAVKTIASSDDEMLPEQPLLAGVNIAGRKTGAEAPFNRLKTSFMCFCVSRNYGEPTELPGGPTQ